MADMIENKRKSGSVRSPRYPAVGLESAIARAERVYDKDYQAPCSREVVASNMGYGSFNGGARVMLSALVKYGLLDRQGDEIRVSDRAVAIIVNKPGATERINAIREAAGEPKLFQTLDERFNGGQASDDNIASFLLMQKFTRDAAQKAVAAYRETKNFLKNEGVEGGSIDSGAKLNNQQFNDDEEYEGEPGTEGQAQSPDSAKKGIQPAQQGAIAPPPTGTRRMVYALDEGDVSIYFPEEISRESVEDLKGYIEIFIRKIERQAEAK